MRSLAEIVFKQFLTNPLFVGSNFRSFLGEHKLPQSLLPFTSNRGRCVGFMGKSQRRCEGSHQIIVSFYDKTRDSPLPDSQLKSSTVTPFSFLVSTTFGAGGIFFYLYIYIYKNPHASIFKKYKKTTLLRKKFIR